MQGTSTKIESWAGPFPGRLAINVVVLIAIAVFFWTQSRIPDLNSKAIMGGSIQLEDPLSFEAKYPINPVDPIWKRIGMTTVNWIFTNMRGMTFGIFFGAAFLCLLRYLPKKSFQNAFANSAFGMAIGAPLGVCVNCAAPIARGMYAGGARLETTLSSMIASPTFNVIVLTMLISLVPFYMAVMKIALTLAVILVAVPLVCRLVSKDELQLPDEEVTACLIDPMAAAQRDQNFAVSLWNFVKDYLRDFFYIIRMTVPLMLLAGFLGAVVATLLPTTLLESLPFNILTISAVALVGILMPVPIAFDIILVATLVAAGAPAGFTMALLFTLGIFSIYSYIIIATSMSRKAANLLAAIIVAFGIAGGYAAKFYSEWEVERSLELLSKSFSITTPAHAGISERVEVKSIEDAAGNLNITRVPFNPRSPKGEKLFTRMEAWKIGVDRPVGFSVAEMTHPFIQMPGGISAADMDNDGDQDIVLADGYDQIKIYLNDGTGKFTQKLLDIPILTEPTLLHAIPADINNDGWLDLVITTFDVGEFVLYSDKGEFNLSGLFPLPNKEDARMVVSLAFGDLNRDGFLEVALGNYSGLTAGMIKGEFDRNRVLINEAGQYTGEKYIDTEGLVGETLSILMSDIDQDQDLDLIEANDFMEPDIFSLGDGAGNLKKLTPADGLIPLTATTTMSAKSADFDNDLKLELYISQISGRTRGLGERVSLQSYEDYCKGIERDADRNDCEFNISAKSWVPHSMTQAQKQQIEICLESSPTIQPACKAMLTRNLAIRSKKPEVCNRISDEFINFRLHCQYAVPTTISEEWRKRVDRLMEFSKGKELAEERVSMAVTEEDIANEIPQKNGANVLLVRNDQNVFEDKAKEANLEIASWTWDIKIFDFDNDGFQDIHIHNGDWLLREFNPSSVFMKNMGDMKFEFHTDEVGLVDHFIVPNATAADFDNDGDIDQVAQVLNGPLMAYWNNSQDGNSVAFEFRDKKGNHFGIGNKVIIHYGNNGEQKQLREIALSGGYMSYDAPIAHFGLADADVISKVDVEWSTGEVSTIEGPFEANATYRIERN